MRLAVVGGGVAGLAGARAALTEARRLNLDLQVILCESSSRVGGKVLTETIEGTTVEWGPDSILATKPRGAGLVRELGLGEDLVAPGPAAKRTYLLLRSRLRPLPAGLAMGVPTGIAPLVRSVSDGIIGPIAAIRAGLEPLIPRSRRGDPTVEEVARKRLGKGVAARLVAPLITGVFGVDAAEISMREAFPQFADSRSLVMAMARRPRRSAGPPFLAVRGGMTRIAEALAGEAGEVRTSTTVNSLRHGSSGFALETNEGIQVADAVLLAVPAPRAAGLLQGVAPQAVTPLQGIGYHSSAIVLLQYAPGAVGRSLDGSGYLVAPEENQATAACTWLSAKWPHNAWPGPWMRATVTAPEFLEMPDDALGERVSSEVGAAVEANANPEGVLVRRWSEALPIYSPGHRERVSAAEAALPSRIKLAGASYRGLGVPDCIAGGETAAGHLLDTFRKGL
ncbi:MAG: protoporphyrinogen oxidase [Actinomycetota bacterium]